MKIVSWNVNSIRTRLDQVLDWLYPQSVDVLCLQETKVVDEDFPRVPFLDEGYQVYVSGQKAYNGVALVSRSALSEVSSGFSPLLENDQAQKFDQQKRLITGIIAPGVRILNLYVPNGSEVGSDKYIYKLEWLALLHDYIEQLRSQGPTHLLVCGDFNIALEDRDIHDSSNRANHIMATDAERQALQTILDLGLQDAFRKFNAESGQFSWWNYRAGAFPKNLGWRIDHHYLTPALYKSAQACTIDVAPRRLPKPSDHAPVVVEIDTTHLN
ncbi:exodeoxyribonuclease III [Acaryochloris sp. IP29b_bin.137]|uniref:exodeoxyribonuclease III n=1 Tax=Acaryochloris sp. IP29b_bin.137 TaxID=2969217 RepID=UPI00262EC9EE|nr:exodeoxyribonuclease III [Acaryochloris sp. IP29b_bin.137]